jgi:16S rRNA (guanine(966)-N(2))-methyltransferase RsmD
VRSTDDGHRAAAIFSSLGDTVIGARVLDLFAGSGALGIEALSRGAASVLFVEGDRQSIAAIKENLAKVNLTGRIRQENVFDFLRRSAGTENFQIIFADPTYEQTKSGERYTENSFHEKLPQPLDSDGVRFGAVSLFRRQIFGMCSHGLRGEVLFIRNRVRNQIR